MKSFLPVCGLAVVLTLAGCGGGEQTAAQSPSPSAQPTPSTPAGPVAFTSVADMAKAIDKAVVEHKSAAFTMTVDGPEKTTGTGAYRQDGAKAALTMTMTTEGEEVTMTVVGADFFVKIPGLEEEQPGKPWVKIDPAGKDPLSQAMAPSLDGMRESVQLGKSLELQQSFTTVKESRAENGGTYYKLVTDVQKGAEQAPNAGVKAELAELVKAGITESASEVWLSKDNLPVKIVQQSADQGRPVAMTVAFQDWGKPVEVTAPPAAQIGKLPPA